MNEKYVRLFEYLCKNCTNISSKALEQQNLDEETKEKFLLYHDSFEMLAQHLQSPDSLEKKDFELMYIAINTLINEIQSNIETLERQKKYYDDTITPMVIQVLASESPEESYKEIFS